MSENEAASTLGTALQVEGAGLARPRTGDGSSVDPAMVELLDLFEGPLREATFPDVSREVLRSLSADVEASVAERDRKAALVAEAEAVVAEAEAAVVAARAALREAEAEAAERQRALLARGQRALSYAKVFAETDPGLHARLSAISLARIAQRGRPPAEGKRVPPREPRTQLAHAGEAEVSALAPRTARANRSVEERARASGAQVPDGGRDEVSTEAGKRGRPAVVRTDSEPDAVSASG